MMTPLINDKVKIVPPPFRKGQIWLLGDRHLFIQHMGKRLVEIKIFAASQGMQGRKRAPRSLERVEILWDYLQTKKAVLQPSAGKLVERGD